MSAIQLCSAAMVRLGTKPIQSFNDGTVEAMVTETIYPSVRDSLLSSHPWSFATTQTRLAQLAENPFPDFNYSYKLPNDFIRIMNIGDTKFANANYRIRKDILTTNDSDVTITYIFRPDEESFPPFFKEALEIRLAAEFCIPITESTTRAEMFFKRAELEERRARLIDSQQDTPAVLNNFSLIDIRQ